MKGNFVKRKFNIGFILQLSAFMLFASLNCLAEGVDDTVVCCDQQIQPPGNELGGIATRFGGSVAVDGNQALIGASNALQHGVVYVYLHDEELDQWIQSDVIFPHDPVLRKGFGSSVKLKNNHAFVYSSDFQSQESPGYLDVFTQVDGDWTHQLTLSDNAGRELFNQFQVYDDLLLKADGLNSIEVYQNTGEQWLLRDNIVISGKIKDFDVDPVNGALAISYIENLSTTGDDFAIYQEKLDYYTWQQTGYLPTFSTVFCHSCTQVVGEPETEVELYNNTMVKLNADQYVEYYQNTGDSWQLQQVFSTGDYANFSLGLYEDRLLFNSSFSRDVYLKSYQLNDGEWIPYVFEPVNTGLIGPVDFSVNGSNHHMSGNHLLLGKSQYKFNEGVAWFYNDGDSGFETPQTIDNLGLTNINLGASLVHNSNHLAIMSQSASQFSNELYMYEKDGDQWQFKQLLRVAEFDMGSAYPLSLSLSQDIMVVGAPGWNLMTQQWGIAYIYQLKDESWQLVQQISSPNTNGSIDESFAYSVDVKNDKLVIGTYGSQDADLLPGSVYFYQYSESDEAWNFVQQLKSPDGYFEDQFGASVSLQDDWLLVGAPSGFSSVTNGNGAAYFYQFNEDLNEYGAGPQKITSEFAGTSTAFGHAVKLDDGYAVIGDPGNGNGMVEILKLNGAIWDKQAVLAPNSGELSVSNFGSSIDIDKQIIVIGAPDSKNGTLSEGDVFVYKKPDQGWQLNSRILDFEMNVQNDFGSAISLSQGELLIGASLSEINGEMSGVVYSQQVSETNDPIEFSVEGLATGASFIVDYGQGVLITVNSNGVFQIDGDFIAGESYLISIVAQPENPTQLCEVNNATVVYGSNENNVVINCQSSLSLSGFLFGMSNGQQMVIENTISEEILTLTSNGKFEFTESLANGQAYDVKIVDQPLNSDYSCKVFNGVGVIDSDNFPDVMIVCFNNFYL